MEQERERNKGNQIWGKEFPFKRQWDDNSTENSYMSQLGFSVS
jgi:hypothetical protein